jgi:hypothetical protein
MPSQLNAQVISANLGSANLQGQIAVQVGHGLVMDKLHQLDAQKKQNEIDRLTELTKPRPTPPPSSGDSPETLYQIALLNEKLEAKNRELDSCAVAIRERDLLLVDWMHSNDAFKRLARQYGKKVGVSDEDRLRDFQQQVINSEEEDPRFKGSNFGATVKARVKPS